METADLIWNRAALENGGSSPSAGDAALANVLAFHGLVMNGGVLDAVERTSPEDLAKVGAAFRWLNLESVADLLASIRQDIGSSALDDLERAEALERAGDSSYQTSLPSDEALMAAFRRRLDDDPGAFSSVLDTGRYMSRSWPGASRRDRPPGRTPGAGASGRGGGAPSP